MNYWSVFAFPPLHWVDGVMVQGLLSACLPFSVFGINRPGLFQRGCCLFYSKCSSRWRCSFATAPKNMVTWTRARCGFPTLSQAPIMRPLRFSLQMVRQGYRPLDEDEVACIFVQYPTCWSAKRLQRLRWQEAMLYVEGATMVLSLGRPLGIGASHVWKAALSLLLWVSVRWMACRLVGSAFHRCQCTLPRTLASCIIMVVSGVVALWVTFRKCC